MDDRELLKMYEPVLRFAKSERFFPMNAERYLESCQLFPSGLKGVVEFFGHFNEPLATQLGSLHSAEYFLRFVNDILSNNDVWVWWGALSAAAVIASWWFARANGVWAALTLALVAALILFMQASPIRLRIIPAAFATCVFVGLEILPVWFFLRPHSFVSAAVEYRVLLPIYVILLFYFFIRTIKFIFDRIIPEAPGVVMDMLSQATERIAQRAYQQYAKTIKRDACPTYYGRVMEERDERGAQWKILQYHYFYAFNDWRLAANGMNHHEGDWELVTVYLKNDLPYAVLFSQHRAGNMAYWRDVLRAPDQDGNPSTHPLVYVALGSHANYSRPEVVRSPNLYHGGWVKRFIYWTDALLRFLFLLVNPDQKVRRAALDTLSARPAKLLSEDTLFNLRDEQDRYIVSLPMEIATGDGFRIGYEGSSRLERTLTSDDYLRRVMSDRKVTHPASDQWECIPLDKEPAWIEYKGLWGVKSFLSNESGPPGPKWDRPIGVQPPEERIRWARPMDWLAELEAAHNH